MKIKDKIAKIVAVKDYSLISGIDNNTIVVTATQNLKKNNLFSGAKSIMSFSDLTKFASNNIDNKNNLNSTEFRYIIHKTIEETIEPERVKVYQNCVPGLEELYTKLLINNISSDNVNSIKFEKYTFVEKDIFEIYKHVREKLGKSKQRIFKESLIQEACEMLSQNNKVAFVGFVFFNDIQEAIIRGIESPELIFINKDNDFIANELIKPLIDKIGRECKVEIVDQDVAGDFYEIEKKTRQILKMPPYGKMAAIIVSGNKRDEVEKTAIYLGQTAFNNSDISTIGPAQAPMFILRNKYRYRLLLKTKKNVKIQSVIAEWMRRVKVPNGVKIEVDIDPYSFY